MKTSIIIGSTGLIGTKLHEILSNNSDQGKLYLVSRSVPNNLSDKSAHIPLENGNYSIPSDVNYAFCCLGTTMSKAGSKEAFLKVDLNMVVDFAKKAKEAGINRFALVSSIGANPKSSNFYLRTKGQAEEELKKIGFERLVIVRPSLLLGKRNEKRVGEDIGKALYYIFRFLFIGPLRKYRGIMDEDVAKAMIVLVEQGQGTIIAESNALKLFSKEYKG
ncbi:MAG: oxidoreductase [Bacteroidetes bacterium HGW-Bacteroidetes-15]|nr:MAG: oxidoreductase [Bacteroidetes bacterium HGW-Bacteroidetes-15]